MKIFTIIVPVYNVGLYIENTIKSIISQDFDDYELILADDGSTDNSADICEYFSAQYRDKIIFIRCSHKGVSATRNEGIKRAQGQYIMFVDGDDYLADGALKCLKEVLESENPDLMYFDFARTERLDEKLSAQSPAAEEIISLSGCDAIKEKLSQKTIPCVCCLVRTDVVRDNSILFDENLMYAEDALFLFTCMLHSKSIIHYKNELYFYYQRPGSATHLKKVSLDVIKMELTAWKKIRKILKADAELKDLVQNRLKPIEKIYYKNRLIELFPALLFIKRMLFNKKR